MDKTMNVFINGEEMCINKSAQFLEVLHKFGAQSPFVILLNQQFIPASKHSEITLQPNDKIEVISAIQGG